MTDGSGDAVCCMAMKLIWKIKPILQNVSYISSFSCFVSQCVIYHSLSFFYVVACTEQEVNRENMKVKILGVEVRFLSPFHYVSLWVMPDKSPLIQNYIKDNYANHSALKQT